MKIYFRFLILLSVFFSNFNVFAQAPTTLEIVDVIFVDSDGNGITDGIEIKFNQPVIDAGIVKGDWDFNNTASDTGSEGADSDNTDVSFIASDTDVDDEYYRINYNEANLAQDTRTEFYFKYTNNNNVKAYYDDTQVLQDIAWTLADDGALPFIDGVSFLPLTGVLKATDNLVVTISASGEDGLDITKGSFSLNEKSITPTLTDNTDGTYTFTYQIEEGDQDQLESAVLPFSFTLFDVAGNESAAYTEGSVGAPAAGESPGIDAHKPVLDGVSFTPVTGNFLKEGSNLVVTISASGEDGLDITKGSFSLNGKTISPTLTDNTDGTYTFTYQIASGDTERGDDAVIPFSFTLFDLAGNESDAYTNIIAGTTADACPGIDLTKPEISLVSFTPGTGNFLKEGSNFVVTISASGEDGLDLSSGSFSLNGKTISPTLSALGGGTGQYQFTYQIASGDTERGDDAVIPFNFTLFDLAGNESDAYTNASQTDADDYPAIDLTKPEISLVSFTPGTGNFLKEGANLVVTISANGEDGLDITKGSFSLNEKTISPTLTDNTDGTYTFTYQIASGDIDRADDEVIPFSFTLFDLAGNESDAYTNASQTNADDYPAIDLTKPILSGVSFTPVTGNFLKEGANLVVTISASGEDGLDITKGSFSLNGKTISPTLSAIGGGSGQYQFTYQIASGDTERGDDAVIPFSFTLFDLAGNESDAYTNIIAGTTADACPAIDLTKPEISLVSFTPGTGNFLKEGSNLVVTISASGEDGLDLSSGSFSLNGKPISLTLSAIGGGSGQYQFTYQIASGDTERGDDEVIPFSFTLFDLAGNESVAYDQDSKPTTAADCPVIDLTKPILSGVSFTPVTGNFLKEGSNLVVTISASGEDGLDITKGSFSLNGKPISPTLSAIGGGSGQYQFTYQIASGDIDRADDEVIPFSFTLFDLAGNESDAYTNVSQTNADDYPAIDLTKPILSGVSFTPVTGNFLKEGSNLVVTISASGESGLDITKGSFSLNGKTISPTITDNTDGTYTFTYQIASGDTERGDDAVIPFNFTLFDLAGNESDAYTNVKAGTTADACPGIDLTKPEISLVSFTPGTGNFLKEGSNLVVTISASGEDGLDLSSGSFSLNGKTISPTLTDNTDGTYTFIYQIASGDTERGDDAVIPFSFTLFDLAGNESDAYTNASQTNADDYPAIDLTKPILSGVSFTPGTGNFLKEGANLVVMISANGEDGLDITKGSFSLNEKTISPTLSAIGGGSGQYQFTYQIASGDIDRADDEVIPFSFTLFDLAGNESDAYTNVSQTNADDYPAIDLTKPILSGVSFTPVTGNFLKEGSNLVVTISASGEDGLDLSSGSFSLNGKPISPTLSAIGGGSGQYQFTYVIASGDTERGDDAVIPFSFTLFDLAGNESDAYTNVIAGTTADACPAIDLTKPILSLVSFTPGSGNFLKEGSNLVVTISASGEDGLDLSSGSFSLNGKPISPTITDNTDGTYTFTYQIASGDTERGDDAVIPFSFTLFDLAGNESDAYTNALQTDVDDYPAIDLTKPILSLVSFTPGTGNFLKEGANLVVMISANGEDGLDITKGSFSLNEKTISPTLTDNTDGTYTFTYQIASGDIDRADDEVIPFSFTLFDLAGNESDAYTNVSQTNADDYPAIDLTKPILSGGSFTPVTGNFLKEGSNLVVTISASGEDGLDLSSGSFSLNGKPISPTLSAIGGGSGQYQFTYVIASGDTERGDDAVIPFSFTLFDLAGNESDAYTNVIAGTTADACPAIDLTKPILSLVSFTPGSGNFLKEGSNLVVTISASGEDGLDLSSGSFSLNGKTISPTLTDNTDGTYTFTYQIASGDTERGDDAVIPFSFTLFDLAGNESDAYTNASQTNADDYPAIDLTKPILSGVSFTQGTGNFLKEGANLVVMISASGEDGLDLSSGSFSLNGKPISPTLSAIGGGSGQYQFTYQIASGDIDRADDEVIPFSFTLFDLAGNESDAYTNVSQTNADDYPAIDLTKPILSGVSFTPVTGNFLKEGSNLVVTISASGEDGLDLSNGSFSLNGKPISPTLSAIGGGSGQYQFTYVIASGDTERGDDAVIPFSFTLFDLAGNESDAYTNVIAGTTADACPAIDLTKPILSLVSFTPARVIFLKEGSNLVVTISASGEDGLDLSSGSFSLNGKPISPTITDNTDGTYTFTYQIASGDTERGDDAVIPFSFTLFDLAGNESDAYTNALQTDVDDYPAIDLTKPILSLVSFTPGTGNFLKEGANLVVMISANGEDGLDITKGSFSLNEKTISPTLTDNTDGTYTFTYQIASGDIDRADDEVIPFSFTLFDLAGNESDAYTNASQMNADDYPAIDDHTPVILSVTSLAIVANSGSILAVGDKITFTVNVANDPAGADDDLLISADQYNGQTIVFSNSGVGNIYTGVYTVADTHVDQASILELTGVTATDLAGNESDPEATSDVAVTIDAHKPVISTVTSAATIANGGSILGVDDYITFTITVLNDPAGTDDDLLISADQYNGQTIVFSNSGVGNIYTGVYTVADTHVDQASILELTGVIANDLAGNVSDPKATSDVAVTIDAHKPVISTVTSAATIANGGSILGVDDYITFTVTVLNDAASADDDLIISADQYNGQTIVFSNSGVGNIYTGVYTVADTHVDQSSIVELIGVIATDLAGNVSDPKATSDVAVTIDAHKPVISTVTSAATVANVGSILGVDDYITFTVTVLNDAAGVDDDLTITADPYNGQTISFSHTSGNSYTGVYTVADTHVDQASILELTGIKATDLAGNVSDPAATSDVAVTIDACKPVISTVTSVATVASGGSVLRDGDFITFTVRVNSDAAGFENDLAISAVDYNGETISFNYTVDNTYVGIYNVNEGDSDQSTVEQLTGIKATDLAGNESDPIATLDVAVTIDAHKPVISTVTSAATVSNGGTILGVGDYITFTATVVNDAAGTEPDLSISADLYNGQTITFNNVGGNIYKGVYTVADTHVDQASILELTGVIATDLAGNISDPVATLDVAVTIDAHKPVINTVTSLATINGGGTILEIGDKITFTVTVADDAAGTEPDLSLSADPYNGQTIAISNSGVGNIYTGVYTVADTHVDQASILELTGVIATDLAGNVSDPVATSDVAVTIDAHRPVISDIIIPDTKMLKGDIIQATITVVADTGNYILNSGSVAGFPISSMLKVDNSTYYAYFTVVTKSYDIQPDQDYSVNDLILSDYAGNISNSFYKNISQGSDPIYTILPTAKVTGKYHACEGDTVALKMQFTGIAPWEIELDNGMSVSTVSGITDNIYYHKIKSINNTAIDADTIVYKINKVKDFNGNVKLNSGIDSAITYIHLVPIADIIDPPGDYTYNINASIDILDGSPAGGVFSGNGITSSNSTFNPSAAGVATHEIIYTYTVPVTGCSDSDTVYYEVVESNASITFDNGDDDWRCDYESFFDITAQVLGIGKETIAGAIKLYDAPGAIDSTGFNTARINVQDLEAGTYQVGFEYIDGAFTTFKRSFTIESVGTASVTDLIDQCEDYDTLFADAYNLLPSGGSGEFIFSGAAGAFQYNPNVSNNNSGYFLPGQINPGSYNLKYIYTTVNECNSDTVIKSFNIDSLPTVSFTMKDVYNIEEGISTINGDPLGAAGIFTPQSFMSNNGDGTADFLPVDAGLGPHWVNYTYEDANGCVNRDSMEIVVSMALGNIASSSGSFQFCYWAAPTDTLIGTPIPTDGSPGEFYIDNVPITPESDNKILFNPQDYLAGSHELEFRYVDGPTAYLKTQTITIDSVGTVSITDLSDKCVDYDTIFVNAYNLIPSEGTGEFIFSGSPGAFDYDLADPQNNSGYFLPGVIDPGTYNLKYIYTNTNACESDTVLQTFNVNPLPTVSFTMNNFYNLAQDPVMVSGDPLGATGVFSPLSYMTNNNDGTAYFNPADAGLGNSWVKYTYEDDNTCVNSDSVQVLVNEAIGNITSSKASFRFCYWGAEVDTLVGTPNPTDGSPGNFYIDGNLIPPFADNKIVVDPKDYRAGNHTVKFEYMDGIITYELTEIIIIDSIGEVFITDLTESCEDYDTIFVNAFNLNPSGGTGEFRFSGSINAFEYNPNDPKNNSIYFIPDKINPGSYGLKYIYTNTYGCESDTVFEIFKINPLPVVSFAINDIYNVAQDPVLISGDPLGSTGVFSPLTYMSNNGNGTAYFDPANAGLGDHWVKYTYEDDNTCVNSDSMQVLVNKATGTITSSKGGFRFCYWGAEVDTLIGTPVPTDGSPGTFYIDGNLIPAFADNKIVVDPKDYRAGDHTVKYEYLDGIISYEIVQTFTIDSVGEVFVTDVADYCEDYDTIFTNAFNLIPPGGTGEFIFSGSINAFEYNPNDPKNNSIYFIPDKINPGSYGLKYIYTNTYGCESDTVFEIFKINPLPVVSFAINDIYNVAQDPVLISGDPLGSTGVFSPLTYMSNNGNGTAYLNPSSAGLGNKWVKYSYQDDKGCSNSDSTLILINQAQGSISSNTGAFKFCYYGGEMDTLIGVPLPTDGTPGSFYIDNVLINPDADNQIVIHPEDYRAGNHTVKFEYTNGPTPYYVTKDINIDSIGKIEFTGLGDEYCENLNDEIPLKASYSDLVGKMKFEGNGITDNTVDEFAYFNPSKASLGNNTISYTFTRDYSGCQKTYTESVKINNIPFVGFHTEEPCIVTATDLVRFIADTLSSDSIVDWKWEFKKLTDFAESPQFVTGIGSNPMKLTLTTNNSCSASLEQSFYIGTRIGLEFSFKNECHGESVEFTLENSGAEIDIDTSIWIFGGEGEADFSGESPTFKYDSAGAYYVIYEEYLYSCGRTADTVKINIRPSIDLSDIEYFEGFEDNPDITGWVIEDVVEGAKNSWQWGEPAGAKINTAAEGNNAFVTNLTGNYENDDNGMVTSPCFDFSSKQRPMMKMDFISASQKDIDGAVIQYTNNDGTWKTLGVKPEQGVNWYNSAAISGSPANQTFGWTGTDNTIWKTAMYSLDELKGRAGVRFRVVFGSNGDITNEGFGFDNIWFGERKRMVLLEHFTNINDDKANASQVNIDDVLELDSMDVLSINYHTSFPTSNGFNLSYPSGPSARALNYGVSMVPYSILDGVNRFDYDVLGLGSLTKENVDRRVLIDPKFEIDLKQDLQNNTLVVSSTVKALEDLAEQNVIIYLAVVEKTVLFNSSTYNNVLRTMLPDAAGTIVEQDWMTDDLVNVYKKWTVPVEVNTDNIVTIAFVQDEETKEIYQSAFIDTYSVLTAMDDLINDGLVSNYRVYPNPVKETLSVQVINPLNFDLDVSLYNGIGLLIKKAKLFGGEQILEFNTKDLPAGVYYIRLANSDKLFETKKIMKVD